MSRLFLLGLSFFVGWSVMVLELTASRLVIPMLGGSLYTWASVIGVVLAGLSVGAYVGGRVIDRSPYTKTLQGTIFLSAGSVVMMMAVSPKLASVVLLPLSPVLLIILVCLVLFFLPALFLGTIQPMVVKLSSKEIHHLGESYGTLSALWSLGSIIGVFSSGFYLIPFFGTWKTLALVVAVLALCGAMLWRGTHRLIGILLIIGAMIPLWNLTPPQGRNVLYSTDTPYFRAVVAEAYIPPIGSSRILFLDTGTHSIHRGTTTIPIYTDSTTLLSRYLGTSSRALVMGGGAYTMPNDLAREMESVDVYEIDPAIPQIVNKYFSMNSKIVTHIGDARQLLRKSPETYDLIVGDSFNSYLAVPWHLLTKEFNREVIQHVSERGLYAISIIAPLEGDGSELYKTVDATLRAVFPFVDAYRFGASPSEIQNIVFVASPSPLDALRTLAQKTQVIPGASGTFADRRVAPPSSSVSVFTDDHTSTETMLLPIARRSLPDSLRLYYGITKQ